MAFGNPSAIYGDQGDDDLNYSFASAPGASNPPVANDAGSFSFDQQPGLSSNQSTIAGAYDKYLGRSGSTDEYNAHLGGGGWNTGDPRIQQSIQNIAGSPEAKTYSSVTNYQSQVQALESEQDPSKRAALRDRLSRDLFTSLKQSGHDVKWQGDQLLVDGRPYEVAGGAPGAPSSGGASSGGGGTRTPYAPVDNLDDLTFGSAYSHASPYDFNGFESLGPTDAATEDLVMNILKNPESLNPQAIATLKAHAKDSLAEMAGTRDADLVDQRYRLGYSEDSPYFSAERNDARRDYDRDLVSSDQNIDINALETNMGDRLNAANVGQSYVGQRFNRAQTGEQNRQAAASSRQAATSLAGGLALNRANFLTQDRQFNSTYDLNRLALEHEIDQDEFDRYQRQFEGA